MENSLIGIVPNIKTTNKALANYVTSLFDQSKNEIFDLQDYEVTDFSKNKAIPEKVINLSKRIDAAHLLIISLEKYNGSYSTKLNNLQDCLSIIPNRKAFGGKPIFLLSSSLDSDGVDLSTVIDHLTKDGDEVLESFSLANFNENFVNNQIVDIDSHLELVRKVNRIKQTYLKSYYKNQYFTCGIDPKRDGGCGDANEY